MLFPDEDGIYNCETGKCEFATDDIFELFDHSNIEFTWGVRLTPKWSFDMFHFMRVVSDMAFEGDVDALINIVQDVAVMFANASNGEELESFIEDTMVLEEVDEGIRNIERMLREND